MGVISTRMDDLAELATAFGTTEAQQVQAAWRAAAMPLVHVRHDSTEERSPYRPDAPGHAFKSEATPLAGEIVVGKNANSAFFDTELDERLTAMGATTLVVCGVLTHNSLEATVRHGANLGYRVIVPADACWAVDVRDLTGRLWPAEDVRRLYAGGLQTRLTKKGPRDVDALLKELALIKKRGYSFDDEAVRVGVCSFGAPVFGPSGLALAGVAVCVNKALLGAARDQRYRKLALDVAGALSERLGGSAPPAPVARPRRVGVAA